MLTIRQAQLVALAKADVDRFGSWMLEHLQPFFPRQCAQAGEHELRPTIRRGIERRRHGFLMRQRGAD